MTDIDLIERLCKDDRRELINIGLKEKVIQEYRINGPNFSANVGNAIYAVKQGIETDPSNGKLWLAHAALEVEFPLHFAKSNKIVADEKPATYKNIHANTYWGER